jgi:hypothetical protein
VTACFAFRRSRPTFMFDLAIYMNNFNIELPPSEQPELACPRICLLVLHERHANRCRHVLQLLQVRKLQR